MSRFIEPSSYFEPQPSLFRPMANLGDLSIASGPAPRSSTAPLEHNSLFDRTQTQSTAPTSHRHKPDTSRDQDRGQDTSRRSSDVPQQELREKILSRLRESEAGEDRPSGRSRSGSHSSASSIVSSVFRLLDHQSARANALEQASQRDRDTLLNGMKEMRDSRTRAETELMKTRTELQMYKIRFDDIREELLRAQSLIDQLSKARNEAEEGWAKDREALRRISTQQMMDNARAEGRKEGWRQGLDRGRWLAQLERASEDTNSRVVYEDEEEEDDLRTPVSISRHQNHPQYERPRSAAHHRPNHTNENRRRHTTPAPVLPSTRQVPMSPTPQPRPMTAPIRSPESIRVMNIHQERPPSALSGHRHPEPQVRSPTQSVRSIARPSSVAPSHRSHRSVEVPPDGYIPTLGPNSRIVLPPPHELTRPAGTDERTSPPARAPSVLSRRTVPTPAPATRSGTETDSQHAPITRDFAYQQPQRPASRVTNPVMPMHQYDEFFDEPGVQDSPRSRDSWGSTRISDYDLISPPRNEAPSAVAIGKRREESPTPQPPAPLRRADSQMSETQRMVEEWRSANSDVVSPVVQRRHIPQASGSVSQPTNSSELLGSSASRGERRAPNRPPSTLPRRDTESTSTISTPSTTSSDRFFRSSNRGDPRASIYTDGPSLFLGPFDSRPQSTAPSTSTHRRKNVERSTSSATVPGINVEPPSHSPTDSAGTRMDPVLLTPEHANRPLVFSSTQADRPSTSHNSKDSVVVMQSNGLPAGFVPLSPATPVPERDRVTPSQHLPFGYPGVDFAYCWTIHGQPHMYFYLAKQPPPPPTRSFRMYYSAIPMYTNLSHPIWSAMRMKTLAAPTSCEYACHPLDRSGHKLISSPHAIAYDGPWSIFDCVYYTTGLSENPRTCHYNKATGLLAVTSTIATQCPPAALKCADTATPQFSAMDNPEEPVWVVKGNTQLYYKMNPPDAHH